MVDIPKGAPQSGSFDPKAAVRSLVNSTRETAGRKLAFWEQCAAFYALYNGTPQRIVADAFGVTIGTVSNLGGCLRCDDRRNLEINGDIIKARSLNKGRQPGRLMRYRRIAEEWARLGEAAFAEKYYTDAIHTRLQKVKYDVDNEASQRARRGFDPADHGAAGPFVNRDSQELIVIIHDDPPGWYLDTPDGQSFGREAREGGDRRGWPTDRQARAAADE